MITKKESFEHEFDFWLNQTVIQSSLSAIGVHFSIYTCREFLSGN